MIGQIEINSLYKQLEKVNKERAMAVKALQEIETLLHNVPATDENVVLAFATTVEVLAQLGEL